MKEFSFIKTSLWVDESFRQMSPEQKLIMLYLLQGTQTNWCGVFKLNISMMGFFLGLREDNVYNAFQAFCKQFRSLVVYDENTSEVAILNWGAMNLVNMNEKSLSAARKDVLSVESDTLMLEMIAASKASKIIEFYTSGLNSIRASRRNSEQLRESFVSQPPLLTDCESGSYRQIEKEKEIEIEIGLCPATAEPPAPLELPESLKEKKNVRNSDERAAAVRIVSYLNEKGRRSFSVDDKLSKVYLNMIIARLRDGVTEEQMRMVVDNRCSAWLGDANMSEYLRPNTLFSPKNITNYIEAAMRSGMGVPAESLLDEPLNDKARYDNWASKMKKDYPKTNTEVRFFKASEFNAFFEERPEWCPVIWEKWSPDLLQKKFKAALRLLEESPTKSKLAPDGLCSYLKQWFLDERDGKH